MKGYVFGDDKFDFVRMVGGKSLEKGQHHVVAFGGNTFCLYGKQNLYLVTDGLRALVLRADRKTDIV